MLVRVQTPLRLYVRTDLLCYSDNAVSTAVSSSQAVASAASSSCGRHYTKLHSSNAVQCVHFVLLVHEQFHFVGKRVLSGVLKDDRMYLHVPVSARMYPYLPA
eukprot:3427452-Pleurochrysis_carterae.AAC.1